MKARIKRVLKLGFPVVAAATVFASSSATAHNYNASAIICEADDTNYTPPGRYFTPYFQINSQRKLTQGEFARMSGQWLAYVQSHFPRAHFLRGDCYSADPAIKDWRIGMPGTQTVEWSPPSASFANPQSTGNGHLVTARTPGNSSRHHPELVVKNCLRQGEDKLFRNICAFQVSYTYCVLGMPDSHFKCGKGQHIGQGDGSVEPGQTTDIVAAGTSVPGQSTRFSFMECKGPLSSVNPILTRANPPRGLCMAG